jgi:hypothetical protein
MAINLGCLHKKFAYNHCGEMGCRNYVNKCPLHSVPGSSTAACNLARAAVLSGLTDETRETVDNAIALSPALEETILLIVELAFRDGEAAECEFGHMPMDHGEPGIAPVE